MGRGAGVVERAGLENQCGCTVTVGSNPTLSAIQLNPDGAVAQLGERQVRNLEVVGSIPICSTISFPDLKI